MSGVVRVPDLLAGRAALDIECLGRIYVPMLQVGGQIVTFLYRHLAMKVASPAVLEQIGTWAGSRWRGPPRTTTAAICQLTRGISYG